MREKGREGPDHFSACQGKAAVIVYSIDFVLTYIGNLYIIKTIYIDYRYIIP